MARWIWDLLFTRSKWEIIKEVPLTREDGARVGTRYVMQNQWGNLKQKDIQ
ncbi:MAG: hypothetical protein LCH86_09905 [Proteobacteria bacterium]|nr:hypothetical protein [Pseudomonadota bacterium]